MRLGESWDARVARISLPMPHALLHRRALTLAVCLTLPTAALAQPGTITSKPLNAPAGDFGDVLFTMLDAKQTGIDFENRIDWDNPRRHLYMHSYAGSGVCIGDYDHDGRPDVYLTGQVQRDRLYRQVGDMVFQDVTDSAGVNLGTAWATGATFLDFENDGDLDLYVCNYDAPNLLYINQGDGTFVEGAKQAGLDFRGASVMAAVADYDHDGYVDIYLLTNRLYPGPVLDQPAMQRLDGRMSVAPDQDELFAEQTRRINGRDERYVIKAGQRDRLYHNNGNGTFSELGESAGITGHHPGLSATWWDYDSDGWADLYVGNDFWDPDRWYRNNRDGTFTDIVHQTLPHTPWFSMGADFGDIDNDGRMDFLAADMSARTHFMSKLWMGDMGDSRWFLESAEPRQYMRNMLYLNTGTPRFMEIGFLAGLASTDWTWAVLFNDLDNDGRIDFFATNGTTNHSFDPDLTRRLQALETDLNARGVTDPQQRWEEMWKTYRQTPPTREPNAAFHNDGDFHFSDAGPAWGLNQETVSYGAAMADLDRDGDLDLIVCHIDDPIGVYRNGSTSGHRILISLQGTRDNRFGIGAQIDLVAKSGRQVRQVYTTHGFESATEPVAQFGLGDDAVVEQLTILWPNGDRQTFDHLPADQWYTITQPGDPPASLPPAASAAAPMFAPLDAAAGLTTPAVHERIFDEYDAQPLIPAKLSHSGPGLAWGDADGDGDEDLFVGAPAGQSGKLFLDDGAGHFTRVSRDVWSDDRESEDMAALWIDVESDGDLDLIVASGSVEKPEGDVTLRDRLYLNDGRAHFTHAPADALADAATSTSTIVAADYDRDGDLDLFAAGRTVPDHYPLAPPSRLLRNDRGRFVDVTPDVAPGLADSGMVTAAVWSDVNNDGWIDLMLTREYGSIACWINTGNGLVDRTTQAGLADLTGWWNSIAAGDVDNDGDMDYVVLNAGLNTKYKTPSAAKPAMLYYADFDGNGQHDIVEAKTGGDHTLLPVRGLSCSSDAMPVVRQRMPTYHDFAGATLDQIYTPQTLAGALVLNAKELASGVLMNQGAAPGATPTFTFQPFHRIAQASPGYGVVVSDLNGNGAADVYFVQNFRHREPETGRWDGGLSQLLLGDGRGHFAPISPDHSGLLVPGDGRGLTISDVNHDGRPDLTLTQNEESILAFVNNAAAGFLEVRLIGKPGNPTAIGARVRVVGPDGVAPQSAEIAAGSGYISQSAAPLYFGLGEGNNDFAVELEVRWPDGATTTHTTEPSARRITITQR